jgi:hypothetical protein
MSSGRILIANDWQSRLGWCVIATHSLTFAMNTVAILLSSLAAGLTPGKRMTTQDADRRNALRCDLL